jgi:hypothetical protein
MPRTSKHAPGADKAALGAIKHIEYFNEDTRISNGADKSAMGTINRPRQGAGVGCSFASLRPYVFPSKEIDLDQHYGARLSPTLHRQRDNLAPAGQSRGSRAYLPTTHDPLAIHHSTDPRQAAWSLPQHHDQGRLSIRARQLRPCRCPARARSRPGCSPCCWSCRPTQGVRSRRRRTAPSSRRSRCGSQSRASSTCPR